MQICSIICKFDPFCNHLLVRLLQEVLHGISLEECLFNVTYWCKLLFNMNFADYVDWYYSKCMSFPFFYSSYDHLKF